MSEYAELLISKVVPAADNIRSRIDVDDLEELTESIRAQGVIEPLIVTESETGGTWELVAGHRRHAAAKAAGLKKVPCMVRTFATPADRFLTMLTENLQRADIDPLDEARAYDRLVREMKVRQKDLASKVGRSPSHISKRLQLLKLPDKAHEMLTGGRLPIGWALQLAELTDPAVVDDLLSVGQRLQQWQIDNALTKQRNAALRARAEAELRKQGLPEAPRECRWSDRWEQTTGPLGATHGHVDGVAGTVLWYRELTDDEVALAEAQAKAKQAAEDAEYEADLAAQRAAAQETESPEEKARRQEIEARREAERVERLEREELTQQIRHDRTDFLRAHLSSKSFDTTAAAGFLAELVLAIGLPEENDPWFTFDDIIPQRVAELLAVGLPPESDADHAVEVLRSLTMSSPAASRRAIAVAVAWDAASGYPPLFGPDRPPCIRACQAYLAAIGYKPSDAEVAADADTAEAA